MNDPEPELTPPDPDDEEMVEKMVCRLPAQALEDRSKGDAVLFHVLSIVAGARAFGLMGELASCLVNDYSKRLQEED